MNLINVTSTYIKQIGFENSNTGTGTGGKIKIIFKSGYEEVREGTEKQFNEFKKAKSPGKHFHEHIKKLPIWRAK